MWCRLLCTARRGRSEVPCTLLQLRSRIRPRPSVFSLVSISTSLPVARFPFPVADAPAQRSTQHSPILLPGRLTSLAATPHIVALAALTLVGVGLPQRPDLGRDLADLLLIDSAHDDVAGLPIDIDLNPLGNGEAHRMGVAELEHRLTALDLGAISHPHDIELTLEPL